jgi:hypothetical protein
LGLRKDDLHAVFFAIVSFVASDRSSQEKRDMNDLKIKATDELFGYQFAVDGLMSATEAQKFLAGISYDTLQSLVVEQVIRKGKMPGRNRTGYCRRSVREYAQSLEV